MTKEERKEKRLKKLWEELEKMQQVGEFKEAYRKFVDKHGYGAFTDMLAGVAKRHEGVHDWTPECAGRCQPVEKAKGEGA